MIDTRIRTMAIVDYNRFYNEGSMKVLPEDLIKEIPSISVIFMIASLNAELYLNDHPEQYHVQKRLVLSLASQAGPEITKRLQQVFSEYQLQGLLPVIVWNYTNLLYYGLVFTHFNQVPGRPFTDQEAKSFWDAYLQLNGVTEQRFDIAPEELKRYANGQNIEFFTVAKFIYQRDFFSTTEMQNQVVRGCMLFEYLEKHPTFGPQMADYYAEFNVTGYRQMFSILLIVFTEAMQADENGFRNPVVDLTGHSVFVNLNFLNAVTVNKLIGSYKSDLLFSILRKGILYQLSPVKYIVLNINFLINYFYKTQIFRLKDYFSEKGITREFLSIKAKEFMEDTYFSALMSRSFKEERLLFSDTARIAADKEFTDAYLRTGGDIALIELKDVLLNAEIKDSADIGKILEAIKTKFLANEGKKRKGIRQLIHALRFMNTHILQFDVQVNTGNYNVFPVIVYTDDAFSADGVNKILSDIFLNELGDWHSEKLIVHPLTIINLHFIELFEEYFSNKLINLFDVIRQYHLHIQAPEYSMTPFDNFAKMYIDQLVPNHLGPTDIYKRYSQELLASLMPSA